MKVHESVRAQLANALAAGYRGKQRAAILEKSWSDLIECARLLHMLFVLEHKPRLARARKSEGGRR